MSDLDRAVEMRGLVKRCGDVEAVGLWERCGSLVQTFEELKA